MGGLMLILTVLGVWLVIAAVMDWDWSLGTVDMYPAETTLGAEVIRWGICIIGLALMFIGMGGCT